MAVHSPFCTYTNFILINISTNRRPLCYCYIYYYRKNHIKQNLFYISHLNFHLCKCFDIREMKAFASKSYFCRHHVHSNIYPLKISYSDGSLSNVSTISLFIAYIFMWPHIFWPSSAMLMWTKLYQMKFLLTIPFHWM